MFIHKIKIRNFKSIYDDYEINFDDIKGIWKISGPVGAGKTTIGEAIIFALFGSIKGKNNSDLISWGEKKSLLEIWMTSNNKNIYVKRENNLYGQSPIYIKVNDEELIFTNKKDAQNKLENELYDVTRSTVEMLCIISFNNFKSLTTLNSSDTKKFLDQILGFYILTQYSETCKILKSNNYNSIVKLEGEIKNLQSQILKLTEILNRSEIDRDIDCEKRNLNLLETQANNIKSDYTLKLTDINNDIINYDKKLYSVLAIGKKLKSEIEFIKKGVCPTCGAKIDQSKLQDKLSERELLLSNYDDLNKLRASKQNEYSTIQSEYNIKYNGILNKINESKSLIIKLEENIKHSSINKLEIDKLEKSINELNEQLRDLNTEDNEWAELYNYLNNDIKLKILGSFIPILNKNILKYTNKLHQPYIVEFDSSFKCNVTTYGYNTQIPITSLSTGQLKTIDMIVILGVLNTIISTNGINIMFLDELFSNLDDSLRNEMCHLLKDNLNTINNSTLFIISHQDINGDFNGYINIELDHSELYKKKSIININKN